MRSWRRFFRSWISHSRAFTSYKQNKKRSNSVPLTFRHDAFLKSRSQLFSHLAGFPAVRIKRHLLGGQLPACVGVIAQINLPERPSPQELSLSPVDWRPGSCGNIGIQWKTAGNSICSNLPQKQKKICRRIPMWAKRKRRQTASHRRLVK